MKLITLQFNFFSNFWYICLYYGWFVCHILFKFYSVFFIFFLIKKILERCVSGIFKETVSSSTWIYNLISFLQITRRLLGDVIILSNTDPRSGIKKEKRSYGKNNKTVLKILPFILILYLKQQSSILWCFCGLKFEESFNNTFFSFIFRCKIIVHAAEKDQIKYFYQNHPGKIAFFYVQTAAWLSCCWHKLLFHNLWNCRVS